MTVKQIYEALSVSRWTVQRAIAGGELAGAIKVKGGPGGRGGTWEVPRSSYLAWIAAHNVVPAADAEAER
jgi:hypothetical protein